MNGMQETSKEWLLTEFKESYEQILKGRNIKGKIYDDYLKAEMLLLSRDKINPRSCPCNYKALGETVNKLYKNWLLENEELLQ
jgi:hypothetical protein